MANYLITGGTGLIGSVLVDQLCQSHSSIIVLTRDTRKAVQKLGNTINAVNNLNEIPANIHFDYVINLAGEPIAGKRWSSRQKLRLWQSRIDLTNQLVDWMRNLNHPPKAMISGSAVGWYGNGEDQELNEHSQAHVEYTHTLCDAWENAAREATSLGVRVCLIRTGLVLTPAGGFLSKLLLPFKLGLGTRLGNGKQYMSWVHIEDLIRAMTFLIGEGIPDEDKSLKSGVFNLASPNPVTNAEFTTMLAKQLRRPAFLSVPDWFLTIVLGEMARLLIKGQRVVPSRLIEQGFKFHYESLSEAFENVLNTKR